MTTFILILLGIILLQGLIIFVVYKIFSNKNKKLIEEIKIKNEDITHLSKSITLLNKNIQNLKQSQSTLSNTINKIDSNKTEEGKDEVIKDSITNFFNK